jgi:hypothetical protein
MDFLRLDAGMSTDSCLASLAFLILVSISAITSEICIIFSSYMQVLFLAAADCGGISGVKTRGAAIKF